MSEPRFIDVFVDPNPNVADGCGLRFKAEDPPRPVSRIRYEGALFTVQGWSSADGGRPCPAYAVTVEDSGSGTATLVYGGDWGLRLKPDSGGTVVGEPYLLLAPSAVLG
jgi:hypothetical protein